MLCSLRSVALAPSRAQTSSLVSAFQAHLLVDRQSSRRITDHPRIPHYHAACAISSVHGASTPSLRLAISTPGHELFHGKLDGARVLLQCSDVALAVFKPHLVEVAEQVVPLRGLVVL